MEPSEKTPEMASTLDELSFAVFGRERTTSVRSGICVTCGEDVNENSFKDALSRKEYAISGMCQKCQDSVFG